ncbi:MAG: ABC transporter permease [Planctomycetota bacterium]|jgi:ABC-2 type transport system permease protein
MGKRFKRLWAVIRKETIQLLRDWRTLTLILSLPVIELFLFAYAVGLTVDHLPTGVADMSMDARSRAFIDALAVSGFFDVDLYLETEAQVLQAIDKGVVKAGVIIPPDFAAQMEHGKAQALVILDGSDAFTVKSGYGAAKAIAQAQAMDVVVEKMERLSISWADPPIKTFTRILYNPDLDDMIFVVPGVAALLLQMMCIGTVSMSIVRERELGTMEQMLVTPIRPIELILGKMIPNAILSALSLLLIILLGVFWFDVPFRGSVGLFAWLSMLFIVSGVGLGLMLSTVTKTQKQSNQMTLVLEVLSMLLTGLIYPRAPMPAWVRFIGNLLPLTYFMRISRGIMTKGIGISFMWGDVLVLVVYGIVVTMIAAKSFKKRLD